MAIPSERIVWPTDLASRYGRNPSTIWRWVTDGRLPPHDVQIGTRRGWKLSTIEAHERAASEAPDKAA